MPAYDLLRPVPFRLFSSGTGGDEGWGRDKTGCERGASLGLRCNLCELFLGGLNMYERQTRQKLPR